MTATMKDIPVKAEKDVVMQRPILQSHQRIVQEQVYKSCIFTRHQKYVPHGRCKEHQPDHEQTPSQQISQRTQKQKARGIASLHGCRNIRCLLIRYIEVSGQNVEDRMAIVEVGDGETGGECEQHVQGH